VTVSAHARRYGWPHRRARARALAALRDGDPCARCGGGMIHPARCRAGPCRACTLHLDHDERGDSSYVGLSHVRCNTSAGGAKGNRLRWGARRARRLPQW
jgi:hypothetical protein